ncbi:MAG: Rne/Rng family ribonuclease [Bacteriovoracia bacterium]
MSTELIINASLPETRIALLEEGEIQELVIERATDKGIVGNIYKGRVTRVLPGMQAAFVDIGLEKAAFLYVDDVYVHDMSSTMGAMGEDVSDDEEYGDYEGQGQNVAPEGPGAPEASESVQAGADQPGESSSEPAMAASEPVQAGADIASDDAEAEAWRSEVEDSDEEAGGEGQEEGHDEGDGRPQEMGPPPGEGDDDSFGNRAPEGTVAPPAERNFNESNSGGGGEGEAPQSAGQGGEGAAAGGGGEGQGRGDRGFGGGRRDRGRGRRGGRNRNRNRNRDRGRDGGRDGGYDRQGRGGQGGDRQDQPNQEYPENYNQMVSDSGDVQTDRSALGEDAQSHLPTHGADHASDRPERGMEGGEGARSENRDQRGGGRHDQRSGRGGRGGRNRQEFRQQRGRDRKIRPKFGSRERPRSGKIEDLLKEGQEVLVQIAKDPIATKGARLTCHVSLAGRHLVCMPTIDHIGVSRRIDRDDERRILRQYVDQHRPKGVGFIVRTASGGKNPERWIKTDIDYLAKLWDDIRHKAETVSAPALVYEDLNSVLRAVRDWLTEEVTKVMVDSRYYYNEIKGFVSNFMPAIGDRVELYQGHIPIFDAYGISTELHRALERKVWLKSGGYIVIDQAEALVAVDVNTGRYVGKKNLEDTILKTNLEAVEEVAYQLRLRNCGGIIIIDLIDMEKEENRHRVYRALENALRKDRARPSIIKMSELGLIEMTRKRTRDTMVRALCTSCNHCEGKGFIKSKETVAYEVLREVERAGIDRDTSKILVQAHPDTIDILAIEERETLDQLERRYKKQIFLQAVMEFHQEQFEVSADESGQRREISGRSNRNRDRDRGRDRDRNRDRNRDRGDRDQNRGDSGGDTPMSARQDRESDGGAPDTADSRESVAPDTGNEGQHDYTPAVPSPGSETSTPLRAQDASFTAPPAKAGGGDEEDEDRLAFLRAQAAQDAAIANLGPAPALTSMHAQGNRNQGRGGGGGRNNNRHGKSMGGRNDRGGGGDRGGRGGRNRNKNRRGGGMNNNNGNRFRGNDRGGGGRGYEQRDSGMQMSAPAESGSSSGSQGTGGSGGSGGDHGGDSIS